MALTKSAALRVAQASATVTVGTPLVGGTWLAIGYGVSGIALVTNGGTGPTVPCTFSCDFSADGSTLAATVAIGSGDTVASSVTTIPYSFGIGSGGDWAYYRPRFGGNTGQNCTGQASDSTTSAVI